MSSSSSSGVDSRSNFASRMIACISGSSTNRASLLLEAGPTLPWNDLRSP
jgi:hypothetical protein